MKNQATHAAKALLIAAALILLAAPAYAQSLPTAPVDQSTVVTEPLEGPDEGDFIHNPKRKPKTPRAPSSLLGESPPLPLPLLGLVVAVALVLA